MIKLFMGEEKFLIKETLKETLKKSQEEFIIFSEGSSFEEVLEEMQNTSFFHSQKKIVIKNPDWLDSELKSHQFIKEVANFSEEEEIILILNQKKLKKNELITYFEKNGKVYHFEKLGNKDLVNFIKKYVEKSGGTIEISSVLKMIDILPKDLFIITNELNKLLAYNLHIKKSSIEPMVSKYLEDDYFELSNALISDNTIQIVSSFNTKISLGVSNMIIINQISSLLTLALRIFHLKNSGYNNAKIAEIIAIHPYRLKKMHELINQARINKIEKVIRIMGECELNIKSGMLDEKSAMNYLLVNLIK